MHSESKDSRSNPLHLTRRPTRQSRQLSSLTLTGSSRPRHTLGRDQSGVDHEEHVSERTTKVGPVDGAVTGGFGGVEILAAGAVKFDGFLVRNVRETEGEEGLAVAEYSRTATKVSLLVFFDLGKREGEGRRVRFRGAAETRGSKQDWTHHFRETSGSYYKTGVNKAVQMSGIRFQLISLVFVELFVRWREKASKSTG